MLPASSVADDKTAAGGKRKKAADRGHSAFLDSLHVRIVTDSPRLSSKSDAVEQKYRNSINNALATLRDTIPALRHLKPLPSVSTALVKSIAYFRLINSARI
jgi:hypothetical protein